MATVQSSDAIKVITVRATGFQAVAAEGGSAAVEKGEAVADPGLSKFIGQELQKSDRPELTSAKIIIPGGRGMGSGETLQLIEQVAVTLGAAGGASRPAVGDCLRPHH